MVPLGLGAAHGVLERGRFAARTAANHKLGTTEPVYLDTGT